MPQKLDVLNTIRDSGNVLIVRLDTADKAFDAASAAVEGGIRALEITLSIPGALRVIERLSERFADRDVVFGAGTVLDEHAAWASIQAGARFLVSPNLNPAMIRVANRYQVATISGAYTPTEVLDTAEAGSDMVKIFPTEAGGIPYVKAMLAPLAQIPMVPAGGVTTANVGEWFAAGVTAVGVGSAITKAGGPEGDTTKITAAAAEFVEAIERARR
ncbi:MULTISPECIES: bifunctional 4-hydroxy-2-oxoglutarate aldolase/2-dehydro-3-deoxy-phosphogluconate aldolase [unclassified Curtobacterium]|jgi:2-dehydro-3-deoxyphosphogluconate aldolase/(4S)-4-hydroxy-2-oxoglutarate aldolase|uniref:bifunctional 4-hydroxy-2-oxoglutarate aldolase/2-dehydro-3-deoxy-phosphogluconate aldolase n=1 Tax=unclassified Curtobacterium TaxID=257496 RepID=UPI00285449B5|nr:bifunctional 4-hydroxy-2-oxoglutarate aldolase/2-dehydro-3-deoxy-phosphogluconate aldolase [Curtobacterium sp. SORGH_AS_0776]MDR6171073.1 2-dehydro-3-deoxyphosphogluconate aldolase/(4S)-4-hydroxy-2-oxoglutarate aldolase [Curtobacterium sp. SORGH_AS_0776]